MGQAGWRDRFGRPSLVLSSALILAAAVPAALAAAPLGKPTSPGASCTDAAAVGQAAARGLAAGAAVSSRLVLGADGAVSGRRLGLSGPAGARDVTLPAESFVASPVGDVIIYGSHEPATGSVIRAFVGATGCDAVLARPPEIVRSAVIDRAGANLYVHQVARDGRRDLGITRFALATGSSTAVLGPPAAGDFGPTFSTQLRWSVEGDDLAVQSCGISRCRTRVLELDTGHVATYAGDGHGDIVGLTDDALYAFDACDWAPCPLIEIDRGTGQPAEVVADALSASFVEQDGRTVLRIETPAGHREVLP